MQNTRLKVGITQGDGNGIGYEVIIKALSDPRILDLFTPVVYGSSKLFGFYRKTIHEIENLDTNVISSAQGGAPQAHQHSQLPPRQRLCRTRPGLSRGRQRSNHGS